MKEPWNSKSIENWISSTVEHPSSTFQKNAEQWLRTIRTEAAPTTNQQPVARGWWKWASWSLPVIAIALVTFTWVFSPSYNSKELLPGNLQASELSEFEELLQMDDSLQLGWVMLEQEQLEILNALSNVQDLGSSLPLITASSANI